MKRLLMAVFFIALLIGAMKPAFAQSSGTISGYVKDALSGEALPGTNLMIKGTSLGTAADARGYYFLKIAPGRFTLVAKYIGYTEKEVEVKVNSGEVVKLDIELEYVGLKGQEVVVTAQAEGQMKAINQQIVARTIKNVVAPDRLQENPDANAAEAIGRLPGISVIRSGGEGTGLVIRGLEPKYSSVTLNGVQLPSTEGGGRNTGISGLSQYVLQGVEVYKAITADMDGNSVAGTVNLTLREAEDARHFDLLTQFGYNHQNDYWGNYLLNANVSSRFFKNKLGVLFSANAERVNRSTQKMNASYSVISQTVGQDEFEKLYLNTTSLEDVQNIKEKQAGTLVIDYKFSPVSKLYLYNFYSRDHADYTSVSKNYNPGGRSVGYFMSQNNDGKSELFSSSIHGEHKIAVLDLDYGLAFSRSLRSTPNNRFWDFGFQTAFPPEYADLATRSLHPSKIIPLALDDTSHASLLKMVLNSLGYNFGKLEENNLTTYLSMKVPFKVNQSINGFVKFGGKYRNKNRLNDNNHRYQTVAANPPFYKLADEQVDWLVLGDGTRPSSVNLNERTIANFLQGGFNFGWYPNIGRLNQLWDWWNNLSNSYLAQGREVWGPIFGEPYKIGFMTSYGASVMGDQDIEEDYWAGYVMSELNLGSKIMLLPGVRYEKIQAEMKGWYVEQSPLELLMIPGHDTTATRKNEFWLPMIHARIKSVNWGHIHFAYTQTLNRPDFNAISPNYHIDRGFNFRYSAGNPALKPEFWTNYDLQFAVYGNTIGLLSLNGFYKTVRDKIWNRSWTRLKGDPIVPGYPEDALIEMSTWLNQAYDVFLQGFETEWQTNFWYLPKPLNYLSLNLNYSYIHSETQYPQSRVENIQVGTDPRGRPIFQRVRIDTTFSGPMLFQPKHLANASLGFNYRGFNGWLSFQYYGEILQGKSTLKELDSFKNEFYRLDLQIVQKLPLKGLEVLFSMANINDFQEKSRPRADSRPTALENYGWTADMGIRYRF